MDRISRAIWFQDDLWELYNRAGDLPIVEFITCNFEMLLNRFPKLKAEYLKGRDDGQG